MNSDQIKQILQTVNQLRAEGATEQNNPTYARLMGVLRQLNMQKPSLSNDQLATLKHQIWAYKLLSVNKPIPNQLQGLLFGDGASPNNSRPQTAGSPVPPSSPNQMKESTETSPYRVLPSTISYTQHGERSNRPIIPAILPTPINPYSTLASRENYIQSRVQYRIKELETIPSNISNEYFHGSGEDGNLKIKLLIELKALKLLEKQKALREELLTGVSKGTMLATAVDRSSYRRMKRQTLREARQTEKLERNQRQEKEKKEKQKQIDFLNGIVNHGRELLNFHRQYQSKFSKLGQAVIKFHGNAEKEEQKRLQKNAQDRIRALRADDEEAYLKLIDQAKDTRITQILQQTNSYLSNLTNAVLHQKRAVTSGEAEMDTSEDAEESIQKDYYNTAHKIKEVIEEQPNILVGGKLKDYQIKGLQWMVSLYNNRLNGILADEMGLGKTIQTISLICYLIEKKKQNGPFLVIVPLSTITNWSLEFDKWAPSVAKIVFKGSPNERKRSSYEIRQGNFNVLLTTYEYIIKERPLLSKIKWIHMIIDEGHRMKNNQSKLSQTLSQYYSSRYRLILTGTPLQNNLPELWALLNFVLPKIFNSVKSFDEWFNSPFAATAATGQDRIDLNEEEQLLIIRRLHKVLRPFLLRRLKKDVESELPDKVETIVKCKMSSLQLRLYEQIRSRRTVFSDEGKSKGFKALNNMVMQFRKICNHPFVFDEVENAINPDHSTNRNLYRTAGKFELLDRVLPKFKQSGHRVLMFFQMTQIMDIMEDFMRFRGYQYLRLDGTTKSEDRSELLKLYNAPNSPFFVFLLSTRAGGLGLNLQTADTVIIFDSDWNPHQDLQAQDRAHRIGQTKEVRILRLITARSVEETILARAQYKLDIDGKVIQAGKFDNKTSEAEREALLRELLGGEGDNDDKEDNEGEIDDDELNEILARSEDELILFRQIDDQLKKRDEDEWRAEGNTGPVPPRLMQDNELPAIYLEDPNDVMDREKKAMQYEILGRGSRQKKEILYDDGLTEEQWLDAIEEGDVGEAIEKVQERQEKRRLKKLQQEESASTDDLSKKRPAEEEPESATKKKKKKTEDKKSPLALAHQRVFTEIFETLEEEQVDGVDYTRQRCSIFLELPDKSLYPDYYAIIKQPIAMDRIKKRINQGYYQSPKDFKADFIQMFDNARLYNVEGSEVYEDAVVLQQVLENEYRRLCPNDTVQILSEDRKDGESIPKSNTGSPTSTAGPLKIKFKMSNGDV